MTGEVVNRVSASIESLMALKKVRNHPILHPILTEPAPRQYPVVQTHWQCVSECVPDGFYMPSGV
jgi:hypothetical protein